MYLRLAGASSAARSSNTGFALVVVLLLMVALSMVGVASLRGITLQEKMAGNLYFRSLSFAEAESALRATVARMDNKIGLTVETPPAPDSSDLNYKPLILTGSNQSHWNTASSWTNTDARSAMSSAAAGLAVNATTEQVLTGDQMPTCEAKMGSSACKVMFTRMTARATDPATGAAVVLQQYWSFPISK